MITLKKIQEARAEIGRLKPETKSLGLVPTMGALHEGHLSLVKAAQQENDLVVTSIFVNPTQFNDENDLERYPRNMKADLAMLEGLGVDLVFAPEVGEIYPNEERRFFDLHPLDTVMEGKYRPGHFAGVAEVVSKLFEIIRPDSAYFGQKDFQQLAVIRRLVQLINQDIRIVSCPIIREKDGLAMSSRNLLLSDEERKTAPYIYETLKMAKSLKNDHSPNEVREFVYKRIDRQAKLRLEYFEIVNEKDLMPVKDWQGDQNKYGCIAVYLGKVRLIDNIKIT